MAGNDFISRRKHPRRRFERLVGVLRAGVYSLCMGVEIGEGGLSLVVPHAIEPGTWLVLNFQIPEGGFICIRAEVKNLRPGKEGRFVVGCAFQNLQFESKREIRAYVSTRSEYETLSH